MRLRPRPLLLLLAAIAACRAGAAPLGGGGTVEVSWTSADTTLGPGSWRGRAEASWCDSTKQLVILGTRGDTGVAIMARSPEADAGEFPLIPRADYATPKHAVTALRFLTGGRVVGLTARGGMLELDSLQPLARGRFSGVATAPGDEDSVMLTGTLDAIPVHAGADGCRATRADVP